MQIKFNNQGDQPTQKNRTQETKNKAVKKTNNKEFDDWESDDWSNNSKNISGEGFTNLNITKISESSFMKKTKKNEEKNSEWSDIWEQQKEKAEKKSKSILGAVENEDFEEENEHSYSHVSPYGNRGTNNSRNRGRKAQGRQNYDQNPRDHYKNKNDFNRESSNTGYNNRGRNNRGRERGLGRGRQNNRNNGQNNWGDNNYNEEEDDEEEEKEVWSSNNSSLNESYVSDWSENQEKEKVDWWGADSKPKHRQKNQKGRNRNKNSNVRVNNKRERGARRGNNWGGRGNHFNKKKNKYLDSKPFEVEGVSNSSSEEKDKEDIYALPSKPKNNCKSVFDMNDEPEEDNRYNRNNNQQRNQNKSKTSNINKFGKYFNPSNSFEREDRDNDYRNIDEFQTDTNNRRNNRGGRGRGGNKRGRGNNYQQSWDEWDNEEGNNDTQRHNQHDNRRERRDDHRQDNGYQDRNLQDEYNNRGRNRGRGRGRGGYQNNYNNNGNGNRRGQRGSFRNRRGNEDIEWAGTTRYDNAESMEAQKQLDYLWDQDDKKKNYYNPKKKNDSQQMEQRFFSSEEEEEDKNVNAWNDSQSTQSKSGNKSKKTGKNKNSRYNDDPEILDNNPTYYETYHDQKVRSMKSDVAASFEIQSGKWVHQAQQDNTIDRLERDEIRTNTAIQASNNYRDDDFNREDINSKGQHKYDHLVSDQYKQDEVNRSMQVNPEAFLDAPTAPMGARFSKEKEYKLQEELNASKRVIKPIHLILHSLEGMKTIKPSKDKGKDEYKEQIEQAIELFRENRKQLTIEIDRNESDPNQFEKTTMNYMTRKNNNLNRIYTTFMQRQEEPFIFNYLRKNDIIQFENHFPIYEKKLEFKEKLELSDCLILRATTGSGKTTQLPQYLLEHSKTGRILVTEPRAIAAESTAKRIQLELNRTGSCPSNVVGYIVGPKLSIQTDTRIVFMTEHEFLKQLINHKMEFLNCFQHFFVDEAHELKNTTLIILACLRNLLRRENNKKKVIIASATLETELFEEYFKGLRLSTINLEAPMHEVEQIYSDEASSSLNLGESTVDHLKRVIEHIKVNFNLSEPRKPNILVFLPSIRTIKEVQKLIEDDLDRFFAEVQKVIQFSIEELHGGLTPSEKQKVIEAGEDSQEYVRIILATRIAETAITLDNIRYVLDSGLEREYFFDEIARLDYLQEQLISESSRMQRKGRAGRVAAGFMFKMYTSEREKQMPQISMPEIQRTNISKLILYSYKLSEFFRFNDLLFSDKIEAKKISKLTNELSFQNLITMNQNTNTNIITPKGEFVLQTSLKLAIGSLLYETLILDIRTLGVLAVVRLKNIRNVFQNQVKF